MRRCVAAVVLLLAGCAYPAAHPPAPPGAAVTVHINPGNIRRLAGDLPQGYEVTVVSELTTPPTTWGLAARSLAIPGRCAALADPAGGHGQSAQGISGSGAGGIVYAMVVAVPAGPVTLDQSSLALCRQWNMTGGRATARIHLVDAPHVDAAETLGMASEIITWVEGGNEIASRATTFTAYLGDYYAFTTLISDPGAPHPGLTPRFAADLLVKTVSALRS